jgi:hypothetical protein
VEGSSTAKLYACMHQLCTALCFNYSPLHSTFLQSAGPRPDVTSSPCGGGVYAYESYCGNLRPLFSTATSYSSS